MKEGGSIPKEHSAVGYIYDRKEGYKAVEKTRPVKNDCGLDLFAYKDKIYEGKTGHVICKAENISSLNGIITQNGGIGRVQQLIENLVAQYGLSPRYVRPDEKKIQVFPPKEKDENIVLSMDLSGEKHYFYRFYNENGLELYTQNNEKEFYATVYVPCEGYMVGIDQKYRLDEILRYLSTLKNGIKEEIERRFSEALDNPSQYANMGFARLLNRMDEAREHNAPILETREQDRRRQAEERMEREQQQREKVEKEYRDSIEEAEKFLLSGQTIDNTDLNGKSRVLSLFREHDITLPLRTQGWVNKSLVAFRYEQSTDRVYLRHNGRTSQVFADAVPRLYEAVLTKQQYVQQSGDIYAEEDMTTQTESDEEMEI